jgi:hypothetical protein
MQSLRSIAAVVAGYLVFALSAAALFQLTGVNPHASASPTFMILTTLFGIVFAALGGMLAVRLSASRSSIQGWAVGALIALGAAASLIFSPATDARWSQVTAILLMAPAASLGGSLLARAPRAHAQG